MQLPQCWERLFIQSWRGAGLAGQRQGPLGARPSALGQLRAGQAGLVNTRGQQLQGELGDDGCEPPDPVWPVQEDRQRVLEVAATAEVGVTLVLLLQQMGQGQGEHFIHLWAGGSERADRVLATAASPIGTTRFPTPDAPTHLLGVGPEALGIQRAHTGQHWHHCGLFLWQEGGRRQGKEGLGRALGQGSLGGGLWGLQPCRPGPPSPAPGLAQASSTH